MAFKLIWSPKAQIDFRDLLYYISESNHQAAVNFGSEVIKVIEKLAEFPESGKMVPEFYNSAIREIICKPYRIIYRVRRNEGLIEITRIWHAARGIPDI